MLAATLVCGLAAFTIWHAIARKQPPGIRQAYAALPDPVRAFVGCPWCFGFWVAVAVTIGHGLYTGTDPVTVTVSALAAGSIPGIIDTFTPDDGELS